jgi:multiple sugar transport system ATP-binding protein
MGSIRLKNVEKWFGQTQVIRGIDLEIGDGEMVVFVGPSGCGKSTLLRMIAGLEDTSAGKIYLDGDDVTDRVPSERALAMVFQSYALYPHMNVAENVGFGLKTAGVPKAEIDSKVGEASAILELDGYLDRRPKELSGGQRQRVAIGRAIVREPKGFLFDEPLSNLDAALRVQMRFEIARLHERLAATMIYVTHDQVEAMTLADRIVVLNAGRIEQVGTPRALYESPASLFVAQFIGSPKMNILPGSGTKTSFTLQGAGKVSGLTTKNAIGGVQCGIRPEHVSVTTKEAHCTGTVALFEYLGSDSFIYVDCGNLGILTVRVADDADYAVNQKVGLTFDAERLHVFAEDGSTIR